MTRLSWHWFRGNEVRLWLNILVCEDWSLTSVQQMLRHQKWKSKYRVGPRGAGTEIPT